MSLNKLETLYLSNIHTPSLWAWYWLWRFQYIKYKKSRWDNATDKTTTSKIRLWQKIRRKKSVALYRHLSVKEYLDLINLDRFKLTTVLRRGSKISSHTMLRGKTGLT